MIYPIRCYGDPVLRRKASPITDFDAALKTLAEDMIATMYDANGIGLAAPQIGVPKRLFVALETAPTPDDEGEDHQEPITVAEKRQRWGVVAEHVMVNPTILERRGDQYGQDGCLSLPGLFVERLLRDLAIVIRYQDIEGNWHQREAEGRFAHVLQHEHDHLDGVLFFDRLAREERIAFMDAHRAELAEMQRQAKQFLKEVGRSPVPVDVR